MKITRILLLQCFSKGNGNNNRIGICSVESYLQILKYIYIYVKVGAAGTGRGYVSQSCNIFFLAGCLPIGENCVKEKFARIAAR